MSYNLLKAIFTSKSFLNKVVGNDLIMITYGNKVVKEVPRLPSKQLPSWVTFME